MKTNMFKTGIVSLAVLIFAACRPLHNDSTTKNIFYSDVRTVTVWNTVVDTVGRLLLPSGSICTATLVYPNIILTAAHCLVEKGKLNDGEYRFDLGYNNGVSKGSAKIVQGAPGTMTPETDTAHDWAYLKLDRNFDHFLGMDNTMGDDNLIIAGYGVDFESGEQLTQHTGCSIKKHMPDGSIYHDCPAAHGDSGSPIIKCDKSSTCAIVAIHTGAFELGQGKALQFGDYMELGTNVGVFSTIMGPKLIQLRQSF